MTGIIYELPIVASLVEEGLKNPEPPNDSIYAKYQKEVKQRVSVVAGSYYDATRLKELANADVFLFKCVFHDNTDAACSKLLAALYQIMKPTAKIIICDCVFKRTPNEWQLAISLDLAMAEPCNGKERTTAERRRGI